MHPFDFYFQEHYAARYSAEQKAESERRFEAFLDCSRPVAGIVLRPLTPHDLLMLDGFGSPFVCGDPADATPEHVISVLWLLRFNAREGFWGRLGFRLHRRNLLRRWRCEELRLGDHADLTLWFESIFSDSGLPQSPGPRKPIGTHFLSALLVPLACELGAFDPASGTPLIEAPLARLFQYTKTLSARRDGKEFIDFSPSDRLKAEALNAWNTMPLEEKAGWLARCSATTPPAAATSPAAATTP